MRAARDMLAPDETANQASETGQLPDGVGPSPEMLRNVLGPIVQGTFDFRMEDRAYAIEVFDKHNQTVRESVPADRLLVYEVKQGWEPLCKFLDVDVPDEPFPHLNDSETFAARIEEFQRQQAEQAAGSADQLAGDGQDLPRPTA
jgi:Sulfotransferase domain